jgi:hypothetical protein
LTVLPSWAGLTVLPSWGTPMIKQLVHVLVIYLQCKHTALKNQRNNRDVFIVRIMYLIESTCLP